jgi:6-phosphogluconolactonase (cycloisomerase 2 family)
MLHSVHRRNAFRLAAVTLTVAGLATPVLAQDDLGGTLRAGKLFISSNSLAGNQLFVYTRHSNAAPTLLTALPTGGTGTGAGLGSQGAVTLSRDGRHLFVVNAGSSTVSTFTFGGGTMTLSSVVPSGGSTPTSVTESNGIVYVLNAGGNGNLAGFVNNNGTLTALPGATYGLSQEGGAAPAQVSFSNYGNVLVVAERNTNRLTSYSVLPGGTLARRGVTATPGVVPFGFAFTPNDTLVLSEAATSSVSSFRFVDDSRIDAPVVVTPALPNGQGAACWIAVTPNGRYAYSANAATSNVSAFGVARNGRLSLLAGVAGLTGSNAGAVDMSVSPDGQHLYVFAPRAPQIVSFTITANGLLTPLGITSGMPGSMAGLASN